ncbi:unnamed protein product, partial [Pelagomonas calceolata]
MSMLLIGMCTSLTKKPTKPMIRKPIIVADAIRANSFLSGLVHFFTRWIERTLTNCLKGCTITALTSDIFAAGSGRCGRCRYLGRCGNCTTSGVTA